jgi:hypothetical protein
LHAHSLHYNYKKTDEYKLPEIMEKYYINDEVIQTRQNIGNNWKINIKVKKQEICVKGKMQCMA